METPKMCSPTRFKKHTSTGLQTTPSQWCSIGPRMEICVNSGVPFGMVPRFHQRNFYIKRKLREWRIPKCTLLLGGKGVLTCTGLQTTPFHAIQHSTEKGNLRKFGSTYRHGTALPPMQCSYQTEAMGMEMPKMYSPSWCKNRTYMYGPANNPISCGAV